MLNNVGKKFFFVLLFFLWSCSGSDPNEIVVYTTVEKKLSDDLLRAFKVWHKDDKLVFVHKDLKSIRKEFLVKEGKKADLVFSEDIYPLEKVLEPYASPNFKNIDVRLGDDRGDGKPRWSAVSGYELVLLANKKKLEKDSISLPESIEDLTKDSFKGKLTLPDLEETNLGYTFLSSLLYEKDLREGFRVLRKIKTIEPTFFFSQEKGFRAFEETSGDFILLKDFFAKDVSMNREDLSIVSLKDLQTTTLEMLAIVKKDEVKEKAKVFYDWMISDEAFSVLEKHRLFINRFKKDGKVSGKEIDKSYLKWMSLNRELILKEWIFRSARSKEDF